MQQVLSLHDAPKIKPIYPRKDQNGRLHKKSYMPQGHCMRKAINFYGDEQTMYMLDVLVTQHAKRIEGRIRRALFGQATSSKVASTDHE